MNETNKAYFTSTNACYGVCYYTVCNLKGTVYCIKVYCGKVVRAWIIIRVPIGVIIGLKLMSQYGISNFVRIIKTVNWTFSYRVAQ